MVQKLINWDGDSVATTIRILPPKSAVAWSRNLPPVEHISPCYECFDSLRSLSISFSPQLKTCHQARQTYEINLLESCESVSVRTSYFKAIVSRHALARLTITRRLDTRYTSTTASAMMKNLRRSEIIWRALQESGKREVGHRLDPIRLMDITRLDTHLEGSPFNGLPSPL